MKFISGNRITNIDEAIRLVLRETGRDGMSEDAVSLFFSSVDKVKLQTEGEKILDSEVHRKYGRNARWRGSMWFVPLPELRYDSLPVPLLTFSVQTCLTAGLSILGSGDSSSTTLVGPIGKPEKLSLPMVFLLAILDDDVESFQIVSKDGTRTSWNIPGFTESLCLPDDFVAEISWVLQGKSVVSWLLSFGEHGRRLAPQVAGCLLGLIYRGKSETPPLTDQVWSQNVVLESLTGMFGAQRAKDLLSRASSYLKADMTNETAIRLILQQAGKEG